MSSATTNWASHHRDVVFGRSGGRVIWQPRIGCWFMDKRFAGTPLPAPFTGMDVPAIYRELGCSARLYEFNACVRRIEDPAVRRHEAALNELDTETRIETPAGTQHEIRRRTPNSWNTSHVKRIVETEDELKVQIWREAHCRWEWDPARYEALLAQLGDLGAPTLYLPRVNLQDLYINLMGTERGIYALYDWPDTVAEYFRVLEESHNRFIDVVNAGPIEIINFGDNIHAGTASPELFREHILPAYQRRCARLHRAGKFVHSHFDGDCKPLLPYLQETGLDGIEAITPVPQGDVTLAETQEALGETMFLIDGLPAVYFDETYPLATLEDCVQEVLERFAPRLVLGISDELSSTGDIERVRRVGEMVAEYNQRVGP